MVSAPICKQASAVLQKRPRLRFSPEVFMPLSMLREFLDRNRIQYLVISHSVAYTAQGIAALTHIPGKELAKTVMVMGMVAWLWRSCPASFAWIYTGSKSISGRTQLNWPPSTNFAAVFPTAKPDPCRRSAISTAWTFSSTRPWPKTRKSPSTRARTGKLVRMRFADFRGLVNPAIIPLAAGKAHTHAA